MKKYKSSKVLSFVIARLLSLSCSIPAFAAETDSGDVVAQTTSNDYNQVIGMTDEQALEYFNEFLESRPNTLSTEPTVTQETLDEFAQYAVDNGIIEDTPEQRGAITKAVVRAEFAVVVAGGKLAGFSTAAALLDHSLQDSPSNLNYGSTSTYATQIAGSSECKKIVSDFKAYVSGRNLSSRTTSGSTTLNSTTDLHLAYNKVSYIASGTKKNGVWNLTITFNDTYDFETQAWKNAMTDSAVVTILNNYAAYAQSIGAIVPYNIKVTVNTTFTES